MAGAIRSFSVVGLLSVLLAAAVFSTNASAQIIETSGGNRSSAPMVRLSGFPADADVDVTFIRTVPDLADGVFSAAARYRTDADGAVSLATRPASGDWTSAQPEAPFWSMQLDGQASAPPDGVVRIQARSGGVSAQTHYTLPSTAPVTIEPVTQFPGAFLARPADASGPLPLIIVLGGSEGDDHTARYIAPRLAAEGFAALGLPYRSPDRGQGQAFPGLPDVFTRIPVERLDDVRAWARRDARVDHRRIGLWGVSKGAEFAILAAAHYRWLDAVAAIVPSDVVWEGFGSGDLERTGTASFSFNGRTLPFVPYGAAGRGREAKDSGRWQNPERAAAARIPIERFPGLLLVAGGEQDRTWDSSGMSQAIAEHRAQAGRPTVSLIFRDAGHELIGDALEPASSHLGGTAEGNGNARMLTWEATIELFRAAWPR
jgi:dienelactone hydrolase